MMLAFGIGFEFGLVRGVGDQVFHAHLGPAVEVVELVDDRLLGGDHRLDFHVGDPLDVVEREHVQGIGHSEKEQVVQS